jgi:hypothetical protein
MVTAIAFSAELRFMEGFPSFGAWVTYTLGTENQELPAFVAINDPRGLARSGKNNF